MKNTTENNYQIQIRIMYFLILLLFLIVLVLSFVLAYSPQSSNIGLVSPDIEERYFESEKIKDGAETSIVSNTALHQVHKREISSEAEKADNAEDDTITLNGTCNIKKSDICEYYHTVEEFCQRYRSESKGEREKKKYDSEGKKKQENKNCILYNITEYQSFTLSNDPFESYSICSLIDFRNDSEPNFTVWLLDNKLTLRQYRFNQEGEYKILKYINLPKETSDWGIVFNGSYYSQSNPKNKIVKYNFETGELTIGDKIDHHSNDAAILFFHSDEESLWVINSEGSYAGFYKVYQITGDLELLAKRKYSFSTDDISYSFVIFGRFYGLDIRKGKIYFPSNLKDKKIRNLSINFPKISDYDFDYVDYNYKDKCLDVIYRNLKEDLTMEYFLYRYKLHFNCSNKFS